MRRLRQGLKSQMQSVHVTVGHNWHVRRSPQEIARLHICDIAVDLELRYKTCRVTAHQWGPRGSIEAIRGPWLKKFKNPWVKQLSGEAKKPQSFQPLTSVKAKDSMQEKVHVKIQDFQLKEQTK